MAYSTKNAAAMFESFAVKEAFDTAIAHLTRNLARHGGTNFIVGSPGSESSGDVIGDHSALERPFA